MKEASVRTTQTPSDTIESVLDRLNKSAEKIDPERRKQEESKRETARDNFDHQRISEILESSGAPKRQLVATTLDRAGEWEQTRCKLSNKLGSGFTISLIGTRGCGKTQLGVELMRQVAQDFKRPKFCSAMEFFMRIKAGYRQDGEPEEKIIGQFTRPELLVIDEIGQRSENEWENRLLYELLNRRYNAVVDTLLISNQDIAQLQLSLGPSLVSRMRETGGVIECNWPSYRK